MNPRRIPDCIASFEALEADVAWVSGFPVIDLPPAINGVIADTDYDAYAICADDCIVTQAALDAVLALVEDGAPAATGWCRLDQGHPLVNLTTEPLRGHSPMESAYSFYAHDEVLSYPAEEIQTGFMGMALTTLPRELWREFPFAVFDDGVTGFASDFNLSMRLRDADVPMHAARAGYVEHVKERWQRADQAPEKRVLVGEIPREVRLEQRAAA